MTAVNGDAPILTLLADVHYFFGDPNQKPPHHRFEKGSYLYLFYNPTGGRGRLQIANNVSGQDADSFSGGLETCDIAYSHRRTTHFTITPSSRAQPESHHWKLPAFEPYGMNKYLYPVRAVDVYLWTPADATKLLETLRGITSVANVNIQDAPSTPPLPKQDRMVTPLVAKLEQAAIATNSPVQYQQHQHAELQDTSLANSSRAPSLAASYEQRASPAAQQPAQAPAPYNPAAPGVPEPISHREKTPPPIDNEPINATFTRANTSHAPQQQPPPAGPGLLSRSSTLQTVPSLPTPGMPAPGISRSSTNISAVSMPLPGGSQSFSPQPTGLSYAASPPATSYAPYARYDSPAAASKPAATSVSPPDGGMYFAPPPAPAESEEPAVSPQSQQGPHTGGIPNLPQQQPQEEQEWQPGSKSPPPGGYSNFQYGSTAAAGQQQLQQHQQQQQGYSPQSPYNSYQPQMSPAYSNHPTYSPQQQYMQQQQYQQQQQQQQQQPNPYATHTQAYRPTEAEAKHGAVPFGLSGPEGSAHSAGPTAAKPDAKLFGVRLDKAEKGVNSFLRKLDRRS